MAGSVLTFFLNNPIQSGSSAGLLDTNQPTASTSTTGYLPGKTSTSFSFETMEFGFKFNNFTNGQPGEPGGPPNTSAHSFAIDCYRTASVYTGVFSLGTWYSGTSFIAVSAAMSGAGNARWRIWHTSSFSGAGAVEFTKFSNNSCLIGSTITNLLTTVAQTSSASTSIAQSVVTGEYIFMQHAWQIRTASGSASADALMRFGPITDLNNGSFLVTSSFSDTTPAAGGGGATAGFYTHRRWYEGAA